MRVRAMTPSGDMRFGQGSSDFLINSPAAVAQLVGTRLKLWAGQWFLDASAGVPYFTQVLGTGTRPLYDLTLRAAILGTPGVVGFVSYGSNLDEPTRTLSMDCQITTLYSTTLLQQALVGSAPANGGILTFTVNF
jgi:hypothetical protein